MNEVFSFLIQFSETVLYVVYFILVTRMNVFTYPIKLFERRREKDVPPWTGDVMT